MSEHFIGATKSLTASAVYVDLKCEPQERENRPSLNRKVGGQLKTLQTCFKTNTHMRQMLPAIRLHGDQLSGFRDVHEMFTPTLIGLLGLFGSMVDSELLFKFKSDPYKLVSCRLMPAYGRAKA